MAVGREIGLVGEGIRGYGEWDGGLGHGAQVGMGGGEGLHRVRVSGVNKDKYPQRVKLGRGAR